MTVWSLRIWESGTALAKSQFISPTIINSLFSRSHLCRNESNSLKASLLELGGLYEALIKKATLCGLRTSIHIISRGSGTRYFVSEKDIVSLIYRTTPPPTILISLSGIESSIFDSFIARISMEEFVRSTHSSSMCFSRLYSNLLF
jgi:hypothetical protein